MNRSFVLTDDAIRAALMPAAEVRAPIDLGPSIRAAIESVPQQRPSTLASFLAPAARPLRVLAIAAVVALLAIVGLLLAIGQRQPIPTQLAVDAPMFRGGPARTGLVAGPGPAANPVIRWDVGLQGPVAANSAAVVGGVVYVADGGGGITALDATTGTKRWSITLPTSANVSPAVAGGLVVVGDSGGDVIALDQATDAQRWTLHTDDTVRSSPAIADGSVYVGSQDGHLYAIDLASGTKRWKFDAGGAITRSPAVDGGVVVIGAEGSILSAIDAKTGVAKWQDHLGTGAGTGTIATPAVHAGVVLATIGVDDAQAQHTLFAVDAATGTERWHWDSPTGEQIYVGSVDGDVVIVNSLDDDIYALQAHRRARRPAPRRPCAGSSRPVAQWGPRRRSRPVSSMSPVGTGPFTP